MWRIDRQSPHSYTAGMSSAPAQSERPETGPKHPVAIFLVANFVYLWAVHAWGLWRPELSGDAALFEYNGYAAQPAIPRAWLNVATHLLGGEILPIRMLNALLLYACMVGVFLLTRAVVKGPWWLGSLAAVLMMANPLKSAAFLSAGGMLHLLPALFAIWGILLAVWPFQKNGAAWGVLGGILILLAQNEGIEYAFCPLVIILLRCASVGVQVIPMLVCVALNVWTVAIQWDALRELSFTPDRFLALLLAVYPIGLLNGTRDFLTAHPAAAWGSVLCMLAAWLGLWRWSKHPAVLWCGLAALALRFAAAPVDLVSMAGGETMILPIACIAMGFAAICHRIMLHPQWPRQVVFLTTCVCLLFFGLQIRALKHWTDAGQVVPTLGRPGAAP